MHPTEKPTTAQLRSHYEAQGYEVRIDDDGHVEFRDAEKGGEWLEGRWVSEYRLVDGKVVLT